MSSQKAVLAPMTLVTNWTALDVNTTNLVQSPVRPFGRGAIQFNKANGGTTSKSAAIYGTVASRRLGAAFAPQDFMTWMVEVSSVAAINYAWVRIGTDASNYAEWRYPDSSLTAGRFTLCHARLADAYVTGKGLDQKAIEFISVGVAFDAATDVLSNMRFGQIQIVDGVTLGENVTVEANIGNVGLLNKAETEIDPATEDKQDDTITLLGTIDADTGVIMTNTGPLVVAGGGGYIRQDSTDTIAKETGGNLANIKTAVEKIDDPVSGSEMLIAGGATQTNDLKVTLDTEAVVLGTGSAAIGKLAANSGVDIGDVDVASLPGSVDGPGAPTIDSYSSAVVDCATGATTSIIATPGASKQLWIFGLMGTADTVDTTIVLKSATTAKTGTMPMAYNGGFVLPPSGNFAQPWLKCATNEAFQITTVTGTFDGVVTYAIVSV